MELYYYVFLREILSIKVDIVMWKLQLTLLPGIKLIKDKKANYEDVSQTRFVNYFSGNN